MMFSYSPNQDTLPENWKLAHITLVLKVGRRHEHSSYWPVAPISIHSKVMEFLVYYKLCDHLSSINFFSSEKYGFRKSLFCIRYLTAVDNHP